jgi:hypothetical protein
MNSFLTKSACTLLISLVVFGAYRGIDAWHRQTQIRAREFAHAEAIRKSHVATEKLALNFANCAADNLNTESLKKFIIYEELPLGVVWKYINTQSNQAVENYLIDHTNLRLSSYFIGDAHNRSLRINESYKKALSGEKTKLILYPDYVFFDAIRNAHQKNTSPYSLSAGERNVNWPHFPALARHCNATPGALNNLLQANVSIKNLPATNMDLTSSENYLTDDYLKLKILFWQEFTKTDAYIKAAAAVERNNKAAIDTLIKEGIAFDKLKLKKQQSESSHLFQEYKQ